MPFCALFPLIPRSFCKQRKGVVLVFAIIFNQTLLFEQLINSNDETLHDTPTHANNLRRVTDEIYLFAANVQFSTLVYSYIYILIRARVHNTIMRRVQMYNHNMTL